MKTLLTIIALIAITIVYFFYKRKLRSTVAGPDTDAIRPPETKLPSFEKPNDKLVIVKDINYSDLKAVLTGLCNLYNKENYQVLARLIKIAETEFAITFPYDINFEIYCYFVNYIKYPKEVEWAADITGWATTKKDDSWIPEEISNKKIIIFVPEDDTEYDNVFMTTADNVGYKIGFGMNKAKQLQDSPKKIFVSPPVTIQDLLGKESDDFS